MEIHILEHQVREIMLGILSVGFLTKSPRTRPRQLICMNSYLLDWCDSAKCCADPPVMSWAEMTKGPSVPFSDYMRRHDHTLNINHDLRFAHQRICDNQQILAM